MRLPSNTTQTYNDLNGAEATEIVVDWVRQLLSRQPLLQPHLTLPNAKISIDLGIKVEMFAGGAVPFSSAPDALQFSGGLTVLHESSGESDSSRCLSGESILSAVINASPTPGGRPPDEIRAAHGLPVMQPGYASSTQPFLSDIPHIPEPAARQGIVADGYVFAPCPASAEGEQQHIPIGSGAIDIDLSGRGEMRSGPVVNYGPTHRASVKAQGDGKGAIYGSVTGTYDPGPAGLAMPGGGARPRLSFGNNHRG
jgi:hypothetical protein